jgi:DNA-binding XRE family transcriptional regulator|tara:strand:- start:229 stop:426 length:198 start_codon:yes stop_codon:yes gene_type:complete
MEIIMDKILISREEIAIALDVSAQTVYRWEKNGDLFPSIRNSKQCPAKYFKTDFDAWLIKKRNNL